MIEVRKEYCAFCQRACCRKILYGSQIQDFDVATIRPPVFILGHPRTGTTLLHSLLALDEHRFAICNTFCAGFPSCFLWFESIGKVLFKNVIDDTRPMDNVKLHFDLPQEDELATNVLSGGVSPYMPLFFMKQEPSYRPFYSFSNSSPILDCNGGNDTNEDNSDSDQLLPPDEMDQARKQWTRSFMYLVKKLTIRSDNLTKRGSHQQRPRLLLKSPVHTARIPLLLQLFPDAQFVYIHRHPYDVFRSAAHMADTTYWYTYNNTPTNEQILEFILRQYEILWDQYEAGRQLLSQKQLVEVSFDQLESNPIETVELIYRQLDWNISEDYRQALKSELSAVKSYQRNKFRKDVISNELKTILKQRWGPSFERLRYQK